MKGSFNARGVTVHVQVHVGLPEDGTGSESETLAVTHDLGPTHGLGQPETRRVVGKSGGFFQVGRSPKTASAEGT